MNNKDYKEASNQLISEFEEKRDKEFQLGKIEIEPKGLYYKIQGKEKYIFKNWKN